MSAPLLNRPQTCLSCLRRLAMQVANGASNTGSVLGVTAPVASSRFQVRGKNKMARKKEENVIVRLLEDIPKFGRKDAILPVSRSRMRNQWFPAGKAEYMTPTRLQGLGLTRKDVGERDLAFGTEDDVETSEPTLLEQITRPIVELHTLPADRAHAILSFMIPDVISFRRKLIQTPTPADHHHQQQQQVHEQAKDKPRRSPLLAANAVVSAVGPSTSSPKSGQSQQQQSDAPATASSPTETERVDAQNNADFIFGSVSTADIVAAIKERLLADPDASRIALEPAHVRFVGLAGSDRVKTLGSWEIEITVPGGRAQTISKTIEVVPEE
ncbi:hypothetical protein VTK73DRAFT_363 [Phialemonium thermophilum]|uniref:Ribosomal protein L9 domain-containing protein n=1 Tax=Phialemonium thermophilum TaxID=223376 RepID=A0ABR3XEL0_9PEZI